MPAKRPEKTARRATGDAAEALARQLLEQQGLSTLARNAGFRVGELDLVMRDGDIVVFVEVRYRTPSAFGDGLLSVDRGKRRRMVRAAQAWLAKHPALAKHPCRFDVVAVSGAVPAHTQANTPVNSQTMVPNWIRNAFTLDDL